VTSGPLCAAVGVPASGMTNSAPLNRLRKNATKRRKSFFQEPFVPQDKLKPVESTRLTSAAFDAQDELKHRPPEENDFFCSL
jgi:hypothetical protein